MRPFSRCADAPARFTPGRLFVKTVKIIGAGSIGTHHAHAARQLGWSVTVTDISHAALERMRRELYPSRYGAWDETIAQVAPDRVQGHFDVVIIGTPPDSHLPLALTALGDSPTAILIEKPLAPPTASLEALATRAADSATRVFVGYDHVVGRAAQMIASELAAGAVGRPLTIDVEFREHWAGIFRAHPWLAGPADSYLGFWEAGGGAAGEHSHAMNLWQFFAAAGGAGRVRQVQAALDYVTTPDGAAYDRLCLLLLQTESGLLGRVAQDVVTLPARKWARIQGERGAIEWELGHKPGADAVILRRPDQEDEVRVIQKTRPDDFIEELRHIERCCLDGAPSPIDLRHGLETQRLIRTAHESARLGTRVTLDLAPPAGGEGAPHRSQQHVS
jgi:predicted dehydrogenase